jgi:hypothetical protein
MDVKTTFLNEIIEEEVYIEKHQGFEVHGRDSHVCRIKKSLYRLKHAPRAWYSGIDGYLQSMGFTKCNVPNHPRLGHVTQLQLQNHSVNQIVTFPSYI